MFSSAQGQHRRNPNFFQSLTSALITYTADLCSDIGFCYLYYHVNINLQGTKTGKSLQTPSIFRGTLTFGASLQISPFLDVCIVYRECRLQKESFVNQLQDSLPLLSVCCRRLEELLLMEDPATRNYFGKCSCFSLNANINLKTGSRGYCFGD